MTTHDETERKKREELQAEIEDGKKKIRQLENREKGVAAKVIPRGTQDAQPSADRPGCGL